MPPPPPFLVVGFEGRPVARLALPQDATPGLPGRSFAADGTHLLAVVSNTARPARVIPLAGGPPRQLGEARAPETPLGWSPDGGSLLFATKLDGREAIMSAPVAGGAAREIGPMPDRGPAERNAWRNPITFSADGRYLTYSRPTPGSQDRTLVMRPVAGGGERVVTTSLLYHSGFRLVGPGGTPNVAGADFLYLERSGDRAELRAIPPEGTSRLIRSFAAADVGMGKSKGVFGEWVAYVHQPEGQQPGWGTTDPVNHPLRIVVARGPEGVPKEVAAVPGVAAYDDIVWSPDGRWIAATTFADSSQGAGIKVLVVGVSPDGDVSSPARLIDTPITGSAWSLQWLPDGTAVTLYGQSPPDMDFDIWLIPVRNSGRATSLTRDEGTGITYSLLSPDGRYVAYQASVERGASLWLADLGDALQGIRP
jgi:dipeptidyl aminopeptidase/acylaminoacyl peptidase